jgi:hypothetical protein
VKAWMSSRRVVNWRIAVHGMDGHGICIPSSGGEHMEGHLLKWKTAERMFCHRVMLQQELRTGEDHA